MVVREFRRLRGEEWDASFSAKLGKRASKLYREIYNKSPARKRSNRAYRNRVAKFPCGIIEQAYHQLRAEGVPLVGPLSAYALMRQRMLERRNSRDDVDQDSDDLVRARLKAAIAKKA